MTVMWLSLVILPAVVIELVLGVLMIIGAVQMLRVRSHAWGMVASFLALWPCSPASLLGLPMGIWALVVLGRSNVKAAFEVAALQPATASDRTEETSGQHSTGSVFLALGVLVLLLLAVTIGPRLWTSLNQADVDRSPRPAQTTPGELWFDSPQGHQVTFRGPHAPQVGDLLASRLGLDPGQKGGLTVAFQRFHDRFLELETQHTTKSTDEHGHQISRVESFGTELTQLEEQFWRDLESTLTGGQLTGARKIIRLRAGMYSVADTGLLIEIWRVGKIDPWFHWQVSYPSASTNPSREPETESGPQLPEWYRRFWSDPAPAAAKAPEPDLLQLNGVAASRSSVRKPPWPPEPDLVHLDGVAHVADPVGFPVQSLAIQGEHVFAVLGSAVQGKFLRVFDLFEGKRPHAVGLTPPVSVEASQVASSEKHVIVLDAPLLRVFDAANPEALRETGNCTLGPGLRDVALAGGFAYVTDASGVRVVDLADATAPREVVHVDLVEARGIAAVGTYAYVACSVEGLQILDVSDPSSPKSLVSNKTDGAVDVAVVGRYAYVVGGKDAKTLWIADVSDPTRPSVVGKYDHRSAKESIAVAGEWAYVVGDDLDIVDISDPARPRRAGHFAKANAVAAAGDLFYSGANDGVWVMRVVRKAEATP